jgi:ribosome recycling factor
MANELVDEILKDTEEKMRKAAEALQSDLSAVRTGRASPALVDRLKVEYYGTTMPLNQLATISAPEPRLLMIRPWDASALSAIEKAVQKSDLGLTPSSDGKIIRLPIPRLTEERRQDLSKLVSRRVEEGKIALRNSRRDGLEDIREMEKEKMIGEDELYQARDALQELTDKYTERLSEIGQAKEKEIMEV